MPAAKDTKPVKISIGFHGGHVLAARVKPDALAALRAMLGKSGEWHELPTEDGTVALDLTRIDYLMVDQEEHRVGF
jgi:siroheme synthase (precorrin-2 oxidase/ferrochelatase)